MPRRKRSRSRNYSNHKQGIDFTPKETEFNGEIYKSRLEARWAIMFDYMGLPYFYEPLAISYRWHSRNTKYYPDFLVQDITFCPYSYSDNATKNVYLEVKFRDYIPTTRDWTKWASLRQQTDNFAVIFGLGWHYGNSIHEGDSLLIQHHNESMQPYPGSLGFYQCDRCTQTWVEFTGIDEWDYCPYCQNTRGLTDAFNRAYEEACQYAFEQA